MDRTEEIMQALLEIKQLLTGGSAPSVPSPRDRISANIEGLVTIGGATFYCDEPIARDWEPSLVLRQLTQNGHVGSEPSNAFDSGLPKRSPAGYPMHYPVGQYGPQLPGRVLFADSSFQSDSEVVAYQNARAARVARLGPFSPGQT